MAPATAMALLRVPAEVSQKLSFTLENFLLRAHSALLQDGCSRYNLVIKKKKKKLPVNGIFAWMTSFFTCSLEHFLKGSICWSLAKRFLFEYQMYLVHIKGKVLFKVHLWFSDPVRFACKRLKATFLFNHFPPCLKKKCGFRDPRDCQTQSGKSQKKVLVHLMPLSAHTILLCFCCCIKNKWMYII